MLTGRAPLVALSVMATDTLARLQQLGLLA